VQALAGKMRGGEKRGTPTPLPRTARSRSAVENGTADLPTNTTCDTGLGGIDPGHPEVGDKTNRAAHKATRSQHSGSLQSQSPACQPLHVATALSQAILT